MVKKTLGVLLATLMLLPAGAFAAPSAAQLEKQVEMLAEQLEEMRTQLEEVQDTSDYNTDSVEMLESSAESSRVRRCRLIPLTEPYVRTAYTAHAIKLPRVRGQ